MPLLSDNAPAVMADDLSDVSLSPEPKPGAGALTPLQAVALDDPLVLGQCQLGPRRADGAVPIGLGLSGMYCAACALLIESALQKVPGVREVQVQSASQRARLVLDPAQVKLSQVVQAVVAAGYRAWPDGASMAASERQRAQRKLLWRLLVAGFCMMQVMMITTAQYVAGPADIPADIWRLMNWSCWVLSLPVMAFSCGPFFAGAWGALKQGRIAMDTPVALGIAAMFAVSTGVTFGHTEWLGHDAYFDSLTMFVAFLLMGRWLESRAREKVTQSLEALCGRLPEAVERSTAQAPTGKAPADADELARAPTETVPLSALRLGDRVRVAVGQAFPADGLIVAGRTEVDESLLTGESRPVARQSGELVVAGSMNLGAPVWSSVERLGPDTRYQQVVALVQQALSDKPGWMRVADKFAAPFLWAVLLLALLGALAWQWIDPAKSLWVAVSVLVVTCPCALSLAAPSALLAAAGALARGGVLVRRLDALEALSGVGKILFDKTGTLTESAPQVAAVWHRGRVWPIDQPIQQTADRDLPPELMTALHAAASLASQSQHPLSKGLAAWAQALPGSEAAQPWRDVAETAGLGLQAVDAQGICWRLGAADWVLPPMAAQSLPKSWPQGRVWFAPQSAVDSGVDCLADPASAGAVLGISLDEQIRADAHASLQTLRKLGVDVSILSGDQAERVSDFAHRLGLSPPVAVAAAKASPECKLDVLANAQQAAKASGQAVAVVGDGINDAPVLARAQVAFAMDQGAALAQSQADFVVLGGRLAGVPLAVQVSRRAMLIVRQNLVWAAGYNLLCIPLALMGYLPPWLAGLGMALSSLLVVLNSQRSGKGV